MVNDKVIRIAGCLPVDTSRLPQLGDDAPIPVAQQDDTLGKCARCGQDVWIGPRKLFLASLGLIEIACYVCAIEALSGAGEITMVNLNPGRPDRPRR